LESCGAIKVKVKAEGVLGNHILKIVVIGVIGRGVVHHVAH
tara:strand:+ start:1240 stop:1362 length:123 start_codon:yes stop_codon:yes gene_type:complete